MSRGSKITAGINIRTWRVWDTANVEQFTHKEEIINRIAFLSCELCILGVNLYRTHMIGVRNSSYSCCLYILMDESKNKILRPSFQFQFININCNTRVLEFIVQYKLYIVIRVLDLAIAIWTRLCFIYLKISRYLRLHGFQYKLKNVLRSTHFNF